MFTLKVMSLGPNFKAPVRKHPTDAGCDIHSAEKLLIHPDMRRVVSTHLAISVPKGHYGRIAPRSGLALKYGVDVLAGVIDSDFRGEIKVILTNTGCEHFEINVGDRIAQLIIEKISTPRIEVVESLDETIRGDGGFGSTGLK